MLKYFATIYITSITFYAMADKGFLVGLSMFVFVGLPMLLGYLIDKDKGWWK